MLQTWEKKPEIIVFAGPNGSGKTTITRMAKIIEPYINADDIKKTNCCTDLEAAILAENLREKAIQDGISFTFETVLSTERNLELLRKAKSRDYFIRCIYVLTNDPGINVLRVASRMTNGGHGVPKDKIVSRYKKALNLVPQIVEVADIMHIYDNSREPYRIFKKRKDEVFIWPNDCWPEEEIKQLVGIY